MKKSRFSEEQIIGILQEQEAGMKMAEVCVPPAQPALSAPIGYSEPCFCRNSIEVLPSLMVRVTINLRVVSARRAKAGGGRE